MSRNALVVGINQYQHFPPLKAPAIDAEAIAQRLGQYSDFRVMRLPEVVPEGKPVVAQKVAVSAMELKQALVKLFKPEGNQYPDTALLYFSGHGVRDEMGVAEGFLATSDTNPRAGFYGLSLNWLRRLLEESPVRQQIIWLDCCHSGALLDFHEADPGGKGRGRDRSFIAASRNFELAYEDLASDHSVLTRALLDGLDPGRSPDRWITNISLTDFINETLKREIQTPVCSNFGEPIRLTCQQAIAVSVAEVSEDTGICPYKGLSFFDWNSEDPKYFYGRQALTDELLDKVRTSSFLAITGASGSGKSSVLRAGLLHQLQQGQRIFGSDQWDIRLMLPGENPCRNLAAVFVDEGVSRIERAEQQGRAEALIKEGGDGLRRLVQTTDTERVVLVIDQFEEVFTLCQDKAERERFFATLLGAWEGCGGKLCLILAMRADFVGRCFEQSYSGLAQQVQDHLVAVKPMSAEELVEAIEKPAALVGLVLEPGLTSTLLEDVENSPGSLPLLQYTLRELWNRRQNNILQLSTYAQMGGVTGTLKQRADDVYESLPPEQQQAVKHIFLNLMQLGNGTEDTRRRATKNSLVTAKYPTSVIEGVIQRLADANLVVTGELISKGDSNRVAVIDVAHECLIRHWPKLRQWAEDSRDLLRYQRKLETLADVWHDQGRQKRYLLYGKQFSNAYTFHNKFSQDFPLSKCAEDFIKASTRRNYLASVTTSFIAIALIFTPFIEAYFRETNVNQSYKLLNNGKPEIVRKSIISLVEGCNELHGWHPFFRGLGERFFGNCRSLGYPQIKEKLVLHQVDLSDTDLRFADLSNTDLSNVNFQITDLRGANLSNTNLSEADLAGANLANAILIGANLNNVSFFLTNLDNVDVSNANFSSAIIFSTDLTDIQGIDKTQLENGKKPILCNSPLPEKLSRIDKDRDCEQLPQIFVDKGYSASLDEAQLLLSGLDERLNEKSDFLLERMDFARRIEQIKIGSPP